MHLARVIGTLWTTRKHDHLEGAKFMLLQPVRPDRRPEGKPLVAVDTVGCGEGETVFYITAREAVLAWSGDLDTLAPVDAAVVGICDFINGEER